MRSAHTKKPRNYWKHNKLLLEQQASSMRDADIAKLHGVSEKAVRLSRSKLGIARYDKYKIQLRDKRAAHLTILCQTHTAAQIAALEGRTTGAVYQELARLNVKVKRADRKYWNEKRKQQLRIEAQTRTPAELAELHNIAYKYMCQLLSSFDIKAKRAKPAARPSHAPRPTSPRLHAIPSGTSIASRASAQIIWPEHAQIQRIALPNPPANAPVCSSTMRAPYQPGKDWYAQPRGA